MLSLIARSALVVALAAAPIAHAQTLRWASQGDPQTMDPHSQNESMTNMMNGQVYEKLVNRDKHLGIVPALATEWQQVSPTLWRSSCARASSSTTARPSPPTTWCSRWSAAPRPPRPSTSTPPRWASRARSTT